MASLGRMRRTFGAILLTADDNLRRPPLALN
jgi:hypothetical protein